MTPEEIIAKAIWEWHDALQDESSITLSASRVCARAALAALEANGFAVVPQGTRAPFMLAASKDRPSTPHGLRVGPVVYEARGAEPPPPVTLTVTKITPTKF